ncbi:MAG: phenylalanine--tRNA ligase subunit beta [Candidatus Firestonebacteria bacterium]
MKITYNWLRDYVDLNLSPEKLCDKFNSIGLNVASFSPIGNDDFYYDLEILPNRPDCLSIIGLARVLSAILNKSLKLPKFKIKEDKKTKINEYIKVQIKTPNLCLRYSARVVFNLKIKESPIWMQVRLKSVGIKSINNVVDVTNYVLMETGHPLHAFDYDLITGKTILIRNANEDEEIITLDGISRKLSPEMLVISDKKKAIALAGIMGGQETEISSNTSNILLECAYFNPINIRKTSKMLNLSTESSYRFERGVDYEGLVYGLNRATYLIQKLAEGNVVSDYVDLYPKKITPIKIKTRYTRVNKILGSNIKKQEMISCCQRLGFIVSKKTNDYFAVQVPSFRTEIYKEIDIIEEIAQIYGYDKIKESIPKIELKVFPGKLNNKLDDQRKSPWEDFIRENLVSQGLNEAINFSFMSKNWFDKMGLLKENPLVKGLIGITNPLNENWNTLRSTLLPGLLGNVALNVGSCGNKNVKIFETGKVFFQKDNFLEEFKSLGIIITGNIHEKGWLQKDESVSFYYLKGVIEYLFKNLNIEFKLQNDLNEIFQSNCSTSIVVKDEKIGICGEISKNIIEALDMKGNVYYSEIKLPLIEGYANFSKTYSALAKFPGVRRDISFIINNNISAQKISEHLKSFKNDLVEKIDIIDVYEGKQIGDGKKSLTYSIIYRSLDRTLTDKEVDLMNNNLIDSVSNIFNTQIRK